MTRRAKWPKEAPVFRWWSETLEALEPAVWVDSYGSKRPAMRVRRSCGITSTVLLTHLAPLTPVAEEMLAIARGGK